MDEKIREIESDILPQNYLNPFKAIKHIKYLLSCLKETEQERECLSKDLIEERMKIVELRDAIGKHEDFKRARLLVVPLEDEELYQTSKEV
jgi:hypothetical protein